MINFYKVIQNEDSKNELFHLLNDQIATKERHLEIKNYKPKNKIERAFRFFYLNRTSFSGIMVKPRWGYMLGSSVTPDHWTEIIEPVSKKLEDVKITCVDWKDVIKTSLNLMTKMFYYILIHHIIMRQKISIIMNLQNKNT